MRNSASLRRAYAGTLCDRNLNNMSDIPYDPCGHTKIVVSDFNKSRNFYDDIFEELGYKRVLVKADRATWTSPDGYGILIAQAKNANLSYQFGAPGLHHLCLKASSAEAVNRIYSFVSKSGVYVSGAPQKYPEYTDKYYAVYFADPDGIKLEVAYY